MDVLDEALPNDLFVQWHGADTRFGLDGLIFVPIILADVQAPPSIDHLDIVGMGFLSWTPTMRQ
jgi:hypothetical protein